MRGAQGDVALTRAAQMGQLETVVTLIRSGADPNARDRKGLPALVLAAREGHSEVMAELLRAGADPERPHAQRTDAADVRGHERPRGGGERAAKNGARSNDRSSTGQTSLMYAAWKGRTRAIQALLAAGAEVNARPKTARPR